MTAAPHPQPSATIAVPGPIQLSATSIALTDQVAIWTVLAALVLLDIAWSDAIGLTVANWYAPLPAMGVLVAVAAIYRCRCRRIADMAEIGTLWIAFTAAGCVLTYLAATSTRPLQDAAIASIDQSLGFDWPRWRDAVFAHPMLYWSLQLAYMSLLPQIVLSILVLPVVRSAELLRLAIGTLFLTTAVFALWPALGTFAVYGGTVPPWMPELVTLRAVGPWHFDLLTMQGIISMPSYHTVLAILFAYAFRRTGWTGRGIAALNLFMLPSIPPFGWHYLTDIIGGGVIAALCIMGFRWVPSMTRDVVQAGLARPLARSQSWPRA